MFHLYTFIYYESFIQDFKIVINAFKVLKY